MVPKEVRKENEDANEALTLAQGKVHNIML